MALADQNCVPIPAETTPITGEEAGRFQREIPEWMFHGQALMREWEFANFREAIAFVNRIAEIAERECHHPEIHVLADHVRLELTTHKIGGLSMNDFILAAKIDRMLALGE